MGPPAWDSAIASRITLQGNLEDIEGRSGAVVPVQSLEGRQEGQLEGARILDHRSRCDRCLRFVQLPSPIHTSDRTRYAGKAAAYTLMSMKRKGCGFRICRIRTMMQR